MLLAISGQFYKRAVAQEVKTIKQADSINTYLRGWLHVYIRAPKVMELQKLQIKAKDEFMEMYNLISDRLDDAHDEVERKAKARAVQEQAWVFGTAFKAAFGSGSACTYYVHYVLQHLAGHIAHIPCDIMELSGQGLEHCNQLRKQEGRLTNKRHFPVEEVTKLGKRKRGIMGQLMTLETSSALGTTTER
jgi:hypothetical protein